MLHELPPRELTLTLSVQGHLWIGIDFNMPRMNGVDTLRKIREQDMDSFICMISADTFPEVIREVAGLKVSGFIVKPLTQSKLHPIFEKYHRAHG